MATLGAKMLETANRLQLGCCSQQSYDTEVTQALTTFQFPRALQSRLFCYLDNTLSSLSEAC